MTASQKLKVMLKVMLNKILYELLNFVLLCYCLSLNKHLKTHLDYSKTFQT